MYNIIVIASERKLVKQIEFYMRYAGHNVSAAGTAEMISGLNFNAAHAVFFGETLIDDSPLALAKRLRQRMPELRKTPFIYCTHNCSLELRDMCISDHTFDSIMELPFSRVALDEMMFSLNLFDRRAIALSPLDSIPEQAILNFLRFIGEHRTSVVEPQYISYLPLGYYYPEVEEFFACDESDSIKLMNMLQRRGLLDRRIVDKVHCCPICATKDVTFREVCPSCRSIDFSMAEILHHFTCGYIGDFDEFYNPVTQQMICPKCHKLLRHIGLDYEKPASAYKCRGCGHNFAAPAVRGYCPKCGGNYESEKIVDRNIYTYALTLKGKQSIEHNSLIDLSAPSSSGRPFTYPQDVFLAMLHQNRLTSLRLKQNLYLMIFDVPGVPKSKRNEMLMMLNDAKPDSLVMMLDDGGRFILQGFAVDKKDLESRFKALRDRMDNIPELKDIAFRLFVNIFVPGERLLYPDTLKVAYRDFSDHQIDFTSGIFYNETRL